MWVVGWVPGLCGRSWQECGEGLGREWSLGVGWGRECAGFEGDRAGRIWEKGGRYERPYGAELVGVRANDT